MDSARLESDPVEEEAIRWLVRQQSGAWTDADQARFNAWLEAETAHRVHYIRARVTWDHTARLKALGAGVPPGVIPERGSWGDKIFPGGEAAEAPRPPSRDLAAPAGWGGERFEFGKRTKILRAIAATILLAGIAIAWHLWPYGSAYRTEVGGIETVPMSDGSRVTLNTNTEVRLRLDETERRVKLEQGEAFFEVAEDPARPFIVDAGSKRVIAVGTTFSVLRDGDDVRVIVTEGRVRVEDRASPPVLLAPGAIARTAGSRVVVETKPLAETEKLLSWREGYVTFDNVPLADAVAEFNRYNTRKIFIEDPAIEGMRVGGNFRSNNAGAFLDLLQTGFPIVVEEQKEKVILKAR